MTASANANLIREAVPAVPALPERELPRRSILTSIEEPAFATTLEDGPFEVREYPAQIAAEVTFAGDRDSAANAGFRQLVAYIFGANASRTRIAMMPPVVQARAAPQTLAAALAVEAGGDLAWTIRFLIPRTYSLDALPTPNDPRIQLRAIPPARCAVVTFTGLARASDVVKKVAELRAFAGVHRLRADGPSSLARYASPWTPWTMRRSEVLIPLPAEHAALKARADFGASAH